jgi:hypothetical protein
MGDMMEYKVIVTTPDRAEQVINDAAADGFEPKSITALPDGDVLVLLCMEDEGEYAEEE